MKITITTIITFIFILFFNILVKKNKFNNLDERQKFYQYKGAYYSLMTLIIFMIIFSYIIDKLNIAINNYEFSLICILLASTVMNSYSVLTSSYYDKVNFKKMHISLIFLVIFGLVLNYFAFSYVYFMFFISFIIIEIVFLIKMFNFEEVG